MFVRLESSDREPQHDYLNQLQRHAEELKRAPSEWMPWNYRETLERTGALLDAA